MNAAVKLSPYFFDENDGGRWATRTPGLWLRRPTLYPPELIARLTVMLILLNYSVNSFVGQTYSAVHVRRAPLMCLMVTFVILGPAFFGMKNLDVS